MQWNSATEFFAMGGYAVYVWGSYGVSAVVLLAELWLLRRKRQQTLALLREELQSEESPT